MVAETRFASCRPAYINRKDRVKSPFFRAWFGDWRENDNTPVNFANIPEYIATNEERKKQRGIVICTDTQVKADGSTGITDGWKINISREGETNTISHSGDAGLSEKGLSGIRELIENAIFLDSEVHEHHSNNAKDDRIVFDHKFYSLGKDSSGNIGLYKITVEEIYQDSKHPDYQRFHNLKYIEKVADNIGSLTDGNKVRHAESTNDVPTTNYNISDLFTFVKEYDPEFKPKHASKVVNKDGTPLIMYHGTSEQNGEFYVFDYKKAKKKGFLGLKALGKGNYFTSRELDGTERYGSRVIKAYLDIKNPYEYSGGVSFKTEVCNFFGLDEGVSYDELQNEMRVRGYDGVIQYDNNNEISIAVTFDSNQIKSVDNIGTFDKTNPDIRYSKKKTIPIQAYWAETVKENHNFRNILSLLDEMQLSGGKVQLDSKGIELWEH